jgi:hypothetical protein
VRYSGLTELGDPILDTNPSDQFGNFPDAIQGFTTGLGELADFNDTSEVFFVPDTKPMNATLIAEYVPYSSGNDPFLDGDFGIPIERDTIEYKILLPDSDEPERRYLLDFNSISNFDVNQAINSLAYIIENDLLGRSRGLYLRFGDELSAEGYVYDTRTVKTYSQERQAPDGSVFIMNQFSVVDKRFDPSAFDPAQAEVLFNYSGNVDAYVDISDDAFSSSEGLFNGAIENYTNTNTLTSFKTGNLKASRSFNQITYTLVSQNSSLTDTAVLSLTGTSFDADRAVNDLDYILENDLVKRAFFPSES